MSISLSKGQKISLNKADGGQLTKIAVGLGWGKKKGFLGIKSSVDLDASCLVYDEGKTAIDAVFFRKLRSDDGSIVHTGDDLTGGGSENDPNEVINVSLNAVPANVKSVVFVVNSFSGETFKGVPFAFCNVVDATTGSEVARYSLDTAGGNYKGFIIAKVYRHDGEWKFHAIGESCSGRQRTVADIEPQARNHA